MRAEVGPFGTPVGMGGPLEAGTLSEADAPIPFGGIRKGILVGPGAGSAAPLGCGVSTTGVESGMGCGVACAEASISVTAGSGSALEIVFAVVGATFTGGRS